MNPSPRYRYRLLLRACLAAFPVSLVFPLTSAIHAQTTYDWTGATSGNLSGTTTNYSPNGAPGATDIIRWNAASYTTAPTANANLTIGQLLFDAGNTGSLTFGSGANTLTLNGVSGVGIQLNSGSGVVSTGSAKFALGANQTWLNNSANTFTVGGTVNLSTNALTIDGSGTSTLNGIISGTGSITKTGTGLLTLNATNTYSGGTTISAGTVRITNASALGNSSGAVSVASGATLDLRSQTVTNTNALTLNGTGVNSGGALTNTGSAAASYAGLVTLGSDSSIISSGTSGVGLTLGNTGTITGSGYNLTVGGTSASAIASVIGTGSGGLIKQDTGTLTLSGANTYTGNTTINGGGITLSGAGAINSASALILSGTLTDSQTAGSTQTFASTTLNLGYSSIVNATASNVVNLQTTTRNAGAMFNVTLGGATNTSLAVDSTGILGTWASTDSGTSLKYAAGGSGGAVTAYTGTSIGVASITSSGNTSNYDVSAVGTLGTGASVNTLRYTGGAGTIAGALTANGLMNAGSGLLTYSGAITIGADKELVITSNTQGVTISGVIADNAGGISSLVYGGPSAGILTLNANNTYTGTTTVASGTLQLGSGATTGAVSGNIVVASGATLKLEHNNAWTVSNDISGGGILFKSNGSGIATLSGNNTYTGGTNLNAGTLLISGSNNLGTGTLTINQGTRFGSADSSSKTISNLANISAVGNTQSVTFGAVQTTGTNTGDLVFTNTGSSIAPNGTGTIIVTNSTSVTFNQVFTNGAAAGVINKTGSGTLVLNGVSTYTGATLVRAGTLVAGTNSLSGSAGAFGLATSAITLADASSTATDNVALMINGAYNVGRALTVNSNNSSGTTTIGGTNAAATTATYSGGITLNRDVALTSQTGGAITDFTGVISESGGARSVVINGGTNAGTVRISGANTYTGTTTVSSGTLALGASNVFANTSNFVLGGATFAAGTFSDSVGTLSLTGNSSITLGSGGTLAFDDSHLLNWGGNTLSITGSFVDGVSIRFGLDNTGLDAAQLALITINGGAASINSLGYLVSSVPEPSTYALLGGALSLGVAAIQRRKRL